MIHGVHKLKIEELSLSQQLLHSTDRIMISVKTNFVTFLPFLVVASLFLVNRVDATFSPGGHHSQRPLLKGSKGAKTTKSARCDSLNFTDIFVFGDSLSDQGNLASVSPFPPARSFTNGNFTVEYISNYFGLDLEMSNHLIAMVAGDIQFITGNNYAVSTAGGALGPALNTPAQVGAFMLKNPNGAPSDALYIVMVGGNDITAAYDARYLYNSNKTDEEFFQDTELFARQVVEFTVQPLIDAGAQHVVVVGAAAVGITPFVTIGQPKERSVFITKVVEAFNDELERVLMNVEDETGMNIVIHQIAGKTELEQIGLQTETPCTIGVVGIPGTTPVIPPLGGGATFPYIYDPACVLPDASGFAFYDELHPADATHEYVAGQIIDQICIEFYPSKQGKSSKKGKKGKDFKKTFYPSKQGKSSKKGKKGKNFKKTKGENIKRLDINRF